MAKHKSKAMHMFAEGKCYGNNLSLSAQVNGTVRFFCLCTLRRREKASENGASAKSLRAALLLDLNMKNPLYIYCDMQAGKYYGLRTKILILI